MILTKPTIYLSLDGVDPSWIVGAIARDIQSVLLDIGFKCRLGSPDEYNGEDICHHMGFAYAIPEKHAKYNSVFITHIDDKMKEKELMSIRDKFDLFVSMSSHDAEYITGLGIPREKVVGIVPPIRNPYVKPVSIGIMSACYDDGRKNEDWLIEFCRSHDVIGLLNFIFIGPRWGKVVTLLEEIGIAFEWHYSNSHMEYEYEYQKTKLANTDYYIYLGFDGGAMGSLDAYGYGRRLILVKDSYHMDIPEVEHYIDNKTDFFKVVREICESHQQRLAFFRQNNAKQYTKKLLSTWIEDRPELFPDVEANASRDKSNHNVALSREKLDQIVNLKRQKYTSLTFKRIISSLLRSLLKWRN